MARVCASVPNERPRRFPCAVARRQVAGPPLATGLAFFMHRDRSWRRHQKRACPRTKALRGSDGAPMDVGMSQFFNVAENNFYLEMIRIDFDRSAQYPRVSVG